MSGDLELTSLPGDGFQVACASRELAGVEPQAATTVRGLLAGLGLDAVAGVLQREGRWWLPCPWQPGSAQPQLHHHCSSRTSSSPGARAAASLQGTGEAGAQGRASRGSSILVLAGSTLSWPPQPQHSLQCLCTHPSRVASGTASPSALWLRRGLLVPPKCGLGLIEEKLVACGMLY